MSIFAKMKIQEPLLSVRGLSKYYGARIGCDAVHFDLFPGEVLGIVGESGSGKSTLLSCLAGHLAPDTGEVVFATRDRAERHRENGRGGTAQVGAHRLGLCAPEPARWFTIWAFRQAEMWGSG